MPQTIKLEDGTEQEVYTKEELEAQAEARAAEVREEIESVKEAELLEKEEELVAAQEELRKAQDKEQNFKNLREKTEKSAKDREANDKKIEELEKTIGDLTGQIAQVAKAPLEAAKAQFVANNIGDDKDLQEKFDLFYSKLGSDAKNMEEVNVALAAAFNAATGGARQPDFTGRMVRTSPSDDFAGLNDSGQESESSQQFGDMLGLSKEDKKNYGGAVKSGSIPLFTQAPSKE